MDSAAVDCLDRVLNPSGSTDQNAGRVRIVLMHPVEKIHARVIIKIQVTQYDINGVLTKDRLSLISCTGCQNGIIALELRCEQR